MKQLKKLLATILALAILLTSVCLEVPTFAIENDDTSVSQPVTDSDSAE